MNDFVSTLKSKLGPLPVWAWAGLGTALLAIVLIRRKAKADSQSAAADQTNSNLGSASELANMFAIAGLMPYQGGDIYVNTTNTSPPPETNPTPPTNIHPIGPEQPRPISSKPQSPYKPRAIYHVQSGDNLSGIAKKYGISESELWKFNTDPKVRTSDAISTLKRRGQNLIFSGEAIYIPPKTYK